jgi:hypothetical protein
MSIFGSLDPEIAEQAAQALADPGSDAPVPYTLTPDAEALFDPESEAGS